MSTFFPAAILSLAISAASYCPAADPAPSSVAALQAYAATPQKFLANSTQTSLPPLTKDVLDQDVRTLQERVKTLTIEKAVLTGREQTAAIEDLIAAAAGPISNSPQTYQLIHLIVNDTSIFSIREAIALGCSSPSAYAPALQTAINTPPTPAYPSIFAVNLAATLRSLETAAGHPLPKARELAAAMLARRLDAALDWPSALRPSVLLGSHLADQALASPLIQNQLALARHEWRTRE